MSHSKETRLFVLGHYGEKDRDGWVQMGKWEEEVWDPIKLVSVWARSFSLTLR